MQLRPHRDRRQLKSFPCRPHPMKRWTRALSNSLIHVQQSGSFREKRSRCETQSQRAAEHDLKTGRMNATIFSMLDECTLLESEQNSSLEKGCKSVESHKLALSTKELGILTLRPQSKTEALAQLRFCATFVGRNRDKGDLVAAAIRNAANVLFWA
jgi:hypothetical protein